MKTPTQKKKRKNIYSFFTLSLLTLAGVFHARLTDGKWRKDIENDGANCCLKAQPDVKLPPASQPREKSKGKRQTRPSQPGQSSSSEILPRDNVFKTSAPMENIRVCLWAGGLMCVPCT
jgi:hypothetical protein